MWKNRENIARLFLAIFMLSLVSSCSFTSLWIDHECIGECCDVCYEINLLRNIFDNLLILSLIYVFIKKLVSYIERINYIWQLNYCLSPVKLKVKMND